VDLKYFSCLQCRKWVSGARRLDDPREPRIVCHMPREGKRKWERDLPIRHPGGRTNVRTNHGFGQWTKMDFATLHMGKPIQTQGPHARRRPKYARTGLAGRTRPRTMATLRRKSRFRDLKRQSGRKRTSRRFSRFRDGKRESGGKRTCAPQGTTKHGPHTRRRPKYARTGLAESALGWPDGRGHAPWPRYGENVGFCFIFMVPGPKTAKWTDENGLRDVFAVP